MANPDTQYNDQINAFFGGIPDSIRQQGPQFSQSAQHFDVYTDPKRLIPLRAMRADNGEDLTFEIVSFLFANSIHYGLGVKVGGAVSKLYYKASDAITGSWTAVSSGESSSGARNTKFFRYFQDYIYGAAAGSNRIWYFGPLSGAASFNETAFGLTNLPTGQGIITSDDLLLVPCLNLIVKKNGAGAGPTANWSTALTLPSDQVIVDLVEHGDLVAILTQPASGYDSGGGQNIRVYLWDKVSPDVEATIDFGEGVGFILESLEGELVVIANVNGSSSFGLKPKLVIRGWSGGPKARVKKEIQADLSTTLTIYGNNVKAKDGNRVIFGLRITIDGVAYRQLASFGRKQDEYPQQFQFERLVDNDTALTGAINGLGKLGDYYWVAHNDNGSVNRTQDNSGIAFTGVSPTFISAKITGENKVFGAHRYNKTLVYAGIICRALASGESISLYYRVNGESSWTLIRTYAYSTDGAGMGFENGRISSDNSPLNSFKELQFKAVSSGGAEILAIPYGWKLGTADVGT